MKVSIPGGTRHPSRGPMVLFVVPRRGTLRDPRRGRRPVVAMSDRVTLNVPRDVYREYKRLHAERYPDQASLWVLLADMLEQEQKQTVVLGDPD